MFGCVPFPTQQRALLSSLLEQLLIYYDISKATNMKQSNSINSYFEFGSFSLITFLHASHFTRLISAPLDSPELSFYGRSHRTFSYLFNTLFNVEQLSDGIGYDLSLFDPEIPLTPIKAYLKHLEKLGFEESKLYPVKIEPRPFVKLPGDIEVPFKLQKFQRDENNEDEIQRRKQVINFAYWILMAGKNPKQLKQTW
uniref:Uncharacterized protein n=1 Tax=Panagrolaimus superbus TaxID=310955 RepID=A0A914Y6H4_9BILA